jgi:predicted short-subunit dehydrogenase-like oxidoreductase (DUF2520 family)
MAETSAPIPPRLRVGVIGTGRSGAPLGAALARAGHPVVAAYAVSDTSRLRAEALLPGVPLLSVPEIVAQADLVLLAVPDDSLAELVVGLAATGHWKVGQFVVHVAGRYGIEVLCAATHAGALPLALHPVMTFTGTSLDLTRLSGVPFGITAPEVLRPVAEALVVEMGGEPVWVPESARPLYHAALAHGSNHLIALVADVLDLLERSGIEHPTSLVEPMLYASLSNVIERGDQALTGPVSRGDAGSVSAHLHALADASPATREAYRAMARLTADRAIAAGILKASDAEKLLAVLAGEIT